MAKLEIIEGIGGFYANKLRAAGIGSVEALLEKGRTPEGRREIEEASGIGHALVLEWVNLADLMRIKGIGEEYSDLLEEAGVDTVKELRNRVPGNLHQKMLEVNKAKRLVRRPPALSQVERWVRQARSLPPKVTY